MLAGWRIERKQSSAEAFSGEGARLYGGRWNSPGRRLVYLSEHQSLAVLEVFIHANPLAPEDDYVLIAAQWEEALTERPPTRTLPRNWRTLPASTEAVAFGDQWIKEARSAVLAVSSVIIPAETNYLFNLQHPDFRKIKIGKTVPFVFDPRMFQR